MGKYQVLSPDGISIERDVKNYSTMEKAYKAFTKWKNNYESQGYYSSTKYGRIDLDDLERYCEFNRTPQ